MGRLVSTKDQNGNTTLNTYDALSRLLSSTDPDLGLTTYAYDLRSQPTERILASGEKTIHQYDELGRVTQTDYLRPESVLGPEGPSGFSGTTPEGIPWTPPDEFCYDVPEFSEPSRFSPNLPSDSFPTLNPLPLTEGDLSHGRALLKLPFDLAISTTEVLRGAAADSKALRFTRSKFEFPTGSSLVIDTNGVVRLNADVSGRGVQSSKAASQQTAPGARGVINVLSGELTLKDKGLRWGVTGEDGSRTSHA